MKEWFAAVFPLVCVILRTTGVFITSPVFGARHVPALVKVTLCLVSGYLLWPEVNAVSVPPTLRGLVGAVAGEICFGLFLGAIAGAILAALELAGQIADTELGLGISSVIDPSSGHSVPLMGMFNYLVVTVLFLALNGHHLFIKALYDSFEVLPAGAGFVPAQWAAISLGTLSRVFLIAATLSSPIWASMLIVDLGLGLVARSVPQMNVFAVGMPVKALVGLCVMSLAVGFYGAFARNVVASVRTVFAGLMGVFSR